MSDFKIFRKISPFIWKRVAYAILGLILILAVLWLCTYWGVQYPEYRIAITTIIATLGIFIGWKIIRGGEKKFRLAQIALITNCVIEKNLSVENTREATRKVKETFENAGVIGLIKNIIKRKNFWGVPQYLMIMISNLLPYSGTCTVAWIFAHPEQAQLPSVCHALTNYRSNGKTVGKKVAWALIKEIIFVVILFFVIWALLTAAYILFKNNVRNFEGVVAQFDDFDETMDVVLGMYFAKGEILDWGIEDVIFIVALYMAWFIKVFTIRAYQMINIVRVFLSVGEKNPPSDDLYNRLINAWQNKGKKKEQEKSNPDES